MRLVRMSIAPAPGTPRTSPIAVNESGCWGRPENLYSLRAFLMLTRTGVGAGTSMRLGAKAPAISRSLLIIAPREQSCHDLVGGFSDDPASFGGRSGLLLG